MILKKKQKCGRAELVDGIRGAEYFWEFYEYVKSLKFEETPDYVKLKEILDKLKMKHCQPLKNKFEWV